MTHNQLQAKCFQWAWNNYPHQRRMMFTVNNNAKNRAHGATLRALGVVSGVSDIILISDCGRVVGVEFKVGKDSQSEEQKEFEERLLKKGGFYYIVSNLEQFQKIVQRHWT